MAHPPQTPIPVPFRPRADSGGNTRRAAAASVPAGAPPRARFDQLFDSLSPHLYRVAYRVLGSGPEAEDVLQDAFLKLSEAPELLTRPDPEVRAWLRRVCLNLSFNRLRDSRRARERVERMGRLDPTPGVDGHAGPDAAALRAEAQREVRAALAELPERQRNCLVLRHSGYAYAEIADTLDIAIGSVGVLLSRAERAFRAVYERRQGPFA